MKTVPKVVRQFGQQVAKIRNERGISQEKLGTLAGVHRTYIGMIERGEKRVSGTVTLKSKRDSHTYLTYLIARRNACYRIFPILFKCDCPAYLVPLTPQRLIAMAVQDAVLVIYVLPMPSDIEFQHKSLLYIEMVRQRKTRTCHEHMNH